MLINFIPDKLTEKQKKSADYAIIIIIISYELKE